MLSLYEILKASKTGIAPDMWTALAGKNWGGADSGHEVKELTGIPPLSFKADGTPLLDWYIKGNTVQNGTPSPSNPVDVNGVGESETIGEHSGQYKIPILNNSQTTNVYLGETQSTRAVKKLVLTGEEEYTSDPSYSRFITTFPNAKFEGLRLTQLYCTHFIAIYDGRPISEVPNNSIYSSDAFERKFFIKTTDYTTVADFKSYLAAQYAAGTPVTVWYIKQTATTGIVNEPLMKIGDYADTLSMEQAGVSIPTVSGTNVIDVETTLKPSEMYIKYQE